MITVSKNNVSVELEHIGEGFDGDYDDTNPNDKPLLRFTVLLDDLQVDDASYCTALSDDISDDDKKRVAEYILNIIYDDVVNGYSIKKICERLSWVTLENVWHNISFVIQY